MCAFHVDIVALFSPACRSEKLPVYSAIGNCKVPVDIKDSPLGHALSTGLRFVCRADRALSTRFVHHSHVAGLEKNYL